VKPIEVLGQMIASGPDVVDVFDREIDVVSGCGIASCDAFGDVDGS
jgi:hypothetical protein